MRFVEKTYTAVVTASAFPWIHLDHYVHEFNVGVQVVVDTVAGSATDTAVDYGIQYTLVDPQTILAGGSAAPIDLVSGQTAGYVGALSVPAGAVRLNVAAVTEATSGAVESADFTIRIAQFG